MSKTDSTSTKNPIAENTKLSLTLKWSEIEPIYNAKIKQVSKGVKLDGFRKGKVPSSLASQAVGFEKVRDLVLDQVLPEAYRALIDDSKKKPLTKPSIREIDVKAGSDWVLEIEIAEAPSIKLGDYKKIAKAAFKEAAEEIKKHLEEHKKAEKENPSQPAHTHTDEENQDIQLRTIFGKLVADVEPQIPELLLRNQTQADLEDLLKSLDQVKISFDQYLSKRGITFEQLSGELAGTALSRLQIEFILQQIATDAKLEANEEEVNAEIDKTADEKLRDQQKANVYYRQYMTGMVTRKKVIDHLLSLST
jgi:FKBP-type peptidyl-prolyl cis-trans isomerase (trigger factor)